MVFLLPVIYALILFLLLRIRSRKEISPLLTGSLLLYVILWNILPTFVTIAFPEQLSRARLVSDETFIEFALLEAAVLFFALLMLLVPRPYYSAITNRAVSAVEIDPRRGLAIALVGLISTILLISFSSLWGFSYLERNSFSTLAQGTPLFNVIGFVTLFEGLLLSFGYAAITAFWPNKVESKFLIAILVTWIFSTVLAEILQGARIAIVVPIMLLWLRGHNLGWSARKFLTTVGAMLFLTLTIGGTVVLLIGQTRGNYDLSTRELISSTDQLSPSPRSLTARSPWIEISDSIVTKYDSISWGAALVQYGGTGVGGWAVFEGAFLALVPRQIYPDKPIPGSIDPTSYYGHPSRLVAALMGFDPSSGNVQVPPASITIWQIGPLGLLPLILLNGFYFYLTNSFLLARSLIVRSLGIWLITIPTLLTLFATMDVLILNIQRSIFVFIFLALIHYFLQTRRVNDRVARRTLNPQVSSGLIE